MTVTIFSADDGVHGLELWGTDGTTGRTTLLLDIKPGAASSYPGDYFVSAQAPLSFAVQGNYAYFAADDGVHGTEMWRTDGTSAGTAQVTDFPDDLGGPSGYMPNDIHAANGFLFFVGNGFSGSGIYKTTGVPGATPDFVSTFSGITAFQSSGSHYYWGSTGGGLYASDGVNPVQHLISGGVGYSLFDFGGTLLSNSTLGVDKVDGTTVTHITGTAGFAANFVDADGTIFFRGGAASDTLYSIAPGASAATTVKTGLGFSFSYGAPSFAALGDKLIFTASDFTHGPELWVSDGTSGGTALLKDILPGVGINFTNAHPTSLTTVGNQVFFQDGDGAGGVDLWKTDGTAAGTVLVKHIESASLDHFGIHEAGDLQNMYAQGNLLLFAASDGVDGTELWRSDGTALGTVQVKAINETTNDLAGIDGSVVTNPVALGAQNIFMDTDLDHGNELWTSDGTVAGTYLLKDIDPGYANSNPTSLTLAGSQIFFSASDGSHGFELWASDGTAGGTRMVSDIKAGLGGSNPSGLLAFGNAVLFAADDGVHGSELWLSNGTAAGTAMLANINPDVGGTPASANPSGFIAAGGKVFFQATANDIGGELWVTDGTALGTHLAKDINPGSNSGVAGLGAGNAVAFGSELYFVASDGTHGGEVWMSDGSNAGTMMLKDIYPGSVGSFPSSLVVANNKLFFIAQDNGGLGGQLYVSNGTAGNATALTATNWSGTLQSLVTAGNEVFFAAYTAGANALELYATDGTAPPTLLDITAGSTGSDPHHLTAIGDKLFFSANDGSGLGEELWVSGGTIATTHMVKDIDFGSGSSQADNFTAVGDRLYFTAFSNMHGFELWVSDGTDAGTHIVQDIVPGDNSSQVGSIKAVGSHVLFVPTAAPHGADEWISDGTDAGTFAITNAVAPHDSNPAGFISIPTAIGADPETLSGTPNGDYLDGLGGNDTLSGLAGDDILVGGAGDDALDGGAGNDTALFSGPLANYAIAYNSGTQTFTVTDQSGGAPDGTDTLTHVETFSFADGSVTYDLANTAAWWSQTTHLDAQGSIASVTVTGDNGGQWVNSVDTTNAGAMLWSVSHYDAGAHLLQTTVTNDDGSHSLTLYDAANAYGWANATITYDASWNQTGLSGTRDDASHTITMGEVAPALDTLLWFTTPYNPDFGAAPADLTVTGGGNTDVLTGYAGNDMLSGGGGNDSLTGGTGNDTLSGGLGDDTFHFRIGDGNDTITDFAAGASGNDVIDLHGYGVASFAALQALMVQVGLDTLIALDADNHILLQNVTMTQLNSGDFVLS